MKGDTEMMYKIETTIANVTPKVFHVSALRPTDEADRSHIADGLIGVYGKKHTVFANMIAAHMGTKREVGSSLMIGATTLTRIE